ncbi:MAG: DUF6286 domain-containing protein [Lapillicoccus sp.]
MSTAQTGPSQPATTLAAAKPPVRPGAVSLLGLLLAVLTTALGLVAVRDALAWAGVVAGEPWLRRVGTAVNGQQASPWLVPVAVVVLLVGLWLLVVALRPRPRPAIRLQAQTGVYLRTSDVARLSRGAAESVGGVLGAGSRASRRSVDVTVTTTGDDATHAAVQDAVTRRLSALESPPKVTVTTHTDTPRPTAPTPEGTTR